MNRATEDIITSLSFLTFWADLTKRFETEGKPAPTHKEAVKLFKNGSDTPADALMLAKNGHGLRALPVGTVVGQEAYHGQYRELSEKGTVWHTLKNGNEEPIAYKSPVAAINAAKEIRARKMVDYLLDDEATDIRFFT